jgi:hypothetical protein
MHTCEAEIKVRLLRARVLISKRKADLYDGSPVAASVPACAAGGNRERIRGILQANPDPGRI